MIKGPVHKITNHVPKDVSERDSALSWIESLILPFLNATLFQIRLLKHIFETRKRAFLDRDPRRKPNSRTCGRRALSERDSCTCILEMRAEAMHGSISANCAVGTKHYLAVRRSCSWLGRRLQCMWTHVVQITKRYRNPKRLSERDSFLCEHSQCLFLRQCIHITPKVCMHVWMSCGTNMNKNQTKLTSINSCEKVQFVFL